MKSLLLITSLFAGLSIFSQENINTATPIEDRKHEIKLDGIKLIAGTIIEGTYEYVQNKNSGFGASLLVNLDSANDYLEDFSITPFYRMYFLNKQDYGAKGFFVEGFGKYTYGDEIIFSSKEGSYNDVSLGMSLGKKWVNSNGFVFEILLGISRTLGSDPGHDVYLRGGLFVGYRL